MTSRRHRPASSAGRGCALFLTLMMASGCATVKRMATRQVADALTGEGGGAFMTDDDPALIEGALPFALKTYEALLLADRDNVDLYLATASGFIQYAVGFLQPEAKALENEDFRKAEKAKKRVTKLTLRGRDYALKGLAVRYPDFEEHLRQDPDATLAQTTVEDVPLLYWAGAGWAAAISSSPGSMTLVGELPLVERLMRRALALDEAWDAGALHEFFILFEGGRGEVMGGGAAKARTHFERALELSGGQRASVYVAMASTVAVQEQDAKLFKEMVDHALAVDVDARPEWRLANVLAQQEAERLYARRGELFLTYEEN